ncbi:helix-turn-helix transcriptional regulator [Dyadobacter sp. CY323]|uniref:helix-turn-helix transcriptional regulator n=1 Tax=Dyadobacter sp. CY323 TaxID=2907302 RepID=UPI001F28675D|nr:helix-turn-helix transcriptional regulator [Dyadobacter sp. CY323]MCE6990187.1 helix-turn-helix transcriptional regulator [Dyadobacter sp. CY323]
MQIFEPVSCLQPYVKAFVVVESNGTFVNRLLPDTSIVAAIRLQGLVQFKEPTGDASLPVWSVSGLRKSFKIAEYGKNSSNILIQFKEGGAAAFLHLPIHELFELNVSLDHFFKHSELNAFQEQLEAADSVQDKVNMVQQFFISRLRYQKPDLLIAHSVQEIKGANGILNVKQLSDNLHISLDAFEKRFRKVVGTTPKQYADIVRMKAVIARAQVAGPITDAALDAGFFDQSHFIRHFKTFTGQTPKDFFHATEQANSLIITPN